MRRPSLPLVMAGRDPAIRLQQEEPRVKPDDDVPVFATGRD